MNQLSLHRLGALILALVFLQSAARAQCREWSDDFAGIGFDKTVAALVEFDDGSGAALYAAGGFGWVNSTRAVGVARWNGGAWTPVGAGLQGSGSDLAVFDDGSGTALYAAVRIDIGVFVENRIMRWNGASWTQVGDAFDDLIEALAVYDDGSGAKLYAAGSFRNIGATLVNRIARWNGAAWESVGGADDRVQAMEVVDQGAGARLYVAGRFSSTGGIVANSVAVWDGTSWTAPWGAVGPEGDVYCIAVHDFGSGSELVVGGTFDAVSGGIVARAVARWNGSSWAAVGNGLSYPTDAELWDLHAFDDGAGTKLYATGHFTTLNGAPARHIARWEGSGWSTLGPGNDAGVNAVTRCLATFDEGNGDELYVGGAFQYAGNVVAGGLARWNGLAWSAVGPGNGQGVLGLVRAVTLHDDGSGSAVWVGGDLTSAGSSFVNDVVRWNGSAWSAAGGAFNNTVECFAASGSGAGSELYAGGFFTEAGGVPANHIARWDGTAWSTMGNGFPGPCYALERFDSGSGPVLHAAYFSGGVRVARWDGSAWIDLPGTLPSRPFGMIGYDDGSGPKLVIGGYFGLYVHDGANWVVFAPLDGPVFYLAEMNGDLIVAGGFDHVGALDTGNVARFDGTSWSSLGGGLTGWVNSLAVVDDGSGSGLTLYAGGQFSFGGITGIARWNGVAWQALDSGPSQGSVFEMTSFDDGAADAPALYVGGIINNFGGLAMRNFGRYGGCGQIGKILCLGDGSGTPCPCGNNSFPFDDAGCLNSTGQGGALRASGSARITHDTLTLHANGLPPTTTALFFQGNSLANGGSGAVFGDGLRCVQGSVVRLGTRTASGGVVMLGDDVPSDPALHIVGGVSIAVRREYQVWYRNAAAFCTPSGFNLTNAVEIDWTN